MSRKPVAKQKGSRPNAQDQSHKLAKHVEETALLASSVEPDKNPTVRKAGPTARAARR
jgi:hypothetical protein